MRYKPKIPVYGGSMAEKKKREFCNDSNDLTDDGRKGTDKTTVTAAAGSRSASGKRIDYKTKQLLGGGPVQRAIKTDLHSLQELFFQELAQRQQQRRLEGEKKQRRSKLFGNYGTTSNALSEDMEMTGMVLEEHERNGNTFQLFKKVYQESKFGIIFTRAAPPRIDNEQFVQLIYSAALSFLEDANVEHRNKNRNKHGNGNQSSEAQNDDDISDSSDDDGDGHDPSLETVKSNFYSHAAFAIYALYTLYKTNPAPHIPIETSTSAVAAENDEEHKVDSNHYHTNKSIYTNSTGNGNGSTTNTNTLFTSNEYKMLSTLPMFETESRKYRRHYHAPIRISYESMRSILEIRNQSLLEIDSCHKSQYNSLTMAHRQRQRRQCQEDNSEKVDYHMTHDCRIRTPSNIFICKCGLAKDCITLIDRLITDQCFHYCEYNGPVSVEALAGSDAYVKKMIFEQDDDKEVERSKNKVVAIGDDDDNQHENNTNQMLKELEEINEQCQSMTEFLQLEDVQKSFHEYHNCLGRASVSLRKKSMGLRPSSLSFSSTARAKGAVGAPAVGNKHQIASILKTMEPITKQRLRRKSIHFPQKIQNMFLRNNDDIENNEEMNDDDVADCNEVLHVQDVSDEEQQRQSTLHPRESVENQNDQRRGQEKVQEILSTTKTGICFTYPASFSKSLKEGIRKALEEIDLLESQTDLEQDKNKGEGEEKGKAKDGTYYRHGNEISIEQVLFDEISLRSDNELIDNGCSDDNSDDVSMDSIVTMDTSHIAGSGNAALQLLLERAKDVIPPNAAKDKSKRKQLKRKREPSPTIARKKKVSSRKNSQYSDDVSESIQSRGSFGTSVLLGENESISVYGSGKAALEELLQTASKVRTKQGVKEKKRSITNYRKQRRRVVASNSSNNNVQNCDLNSTEIDGKEQRQKSENDDVSIYSQISTATGILGSGKEALQDLLRKASQGKSTKEFVHKRSLDANADEIETRKDYVNDNLSYSSKVSTATTNIEGSGQEALQELLHKVAQGRPAKKLYNLDKKKKRRALNDDFSVHSKVSTATDIKGSGQEALCDLLLKSSHSKSLKESIHQSSTNADSDTSVGVDSCVGGIGKRSNHLNDDVSVYSKMSTSTTGIQGSGQEALRELLQKVTK